MKQKNILHTLVIAAVTTFCVAVSSAADEAAPVASPPVSDSPGLLGQTYAGLTYSYVNLDSAPVNADRYALEYNESLTPGFDAVFNYDFTQAGLFDGDRAKQQMFTGAVRAFTSRYTWGKPYAEAGLGYTWTRDASGHDNSIVLAAAVGVEFQLLPVLTVTPYIKYENTPDLNSQNVWNFGVKGNYWVNSQWAVTAGLERNDNQDMKYTIGTNFRF